MKMKIELKFGTPGYIADPYRIERFKLIEIQKISGMNRTRSEKKKREALESYLTTNGMIYQNYLDLEKTANIPFYYNDNKYIYITKESFAACLANTNSEAPSKLRIDNLCSSLHISDFITDKKKADGVWERFAVVKSGTGKALSNQRGYRSNPFIANFTANGVIEFLPEMVKPSDLAELIIYAGRVIGIGASRKMGWGRFEVKIE